MSISRDMRIGVSLNKIIKVNRTHSVEALFLRKTKKNTRKHTQNEASYEEIFFALSSRRKALQKDEKLVEKQKHIFIPYVRCYYVMRI
jgi:hypothetical protein